MSSFWDSNHRTIRIIVALILAVAVSYLLYLNNQPFYQLATSEQSNAQTLLCSTDEKGGECQCKFEQALQGQNHFKLLNSTLAARDSVILDFQTLVAKGNVQVLQADQTKILDNQTLAQTPSKKVLATGGADGAMPLIFSVPQGETASDVQCFFSYKIVSGLLPDGK